MTGYANFAEPITTTRARAAIDGAAAGRNCSAPGLCPYDDGTEEARIWQKARMHALAEKIVADVRASKRCPYL